MITIDQLLIDLYKSGIEKLDTAVPHRDKKILISLAKQLNFGNFLTENQGKLLIKILKENLPHIKHEKEDVALAVEFPLWSKSFRIIEHFRKMYLTKEHSQHIVLEFTYNKSLKLHFQEIRKNLEGQILNESGKLLVPLTEKNILTLVSSFLNHKFKINDDLMEIYEKIKAINESKKEFFEIHSTENKKLQNAVRSEIGDINQDNDLLVRDRRIRFQYTISTPKTGDTLTDKIADRNTTKIFINSSQYSLEDTFTALENLNRLPVLLIFNGHESKDCLNNVIELSEVLSKKPQINNVGIYFRFDNNSEDNIKFNKQISDSKLNSYLAPDTLIAGIENGKLPKFLLNSQWYPKSIISFTNNFKANKTAIYADAVDLVIFHNTKEPLGGGVDAIL